ncbi:DUF2268 domain-containing protein [Neobacillus cucumis]|uniref:DUF2268 domain-containing protein n=1 Tax=Neobacillus cucumis TaxID=1740721 RepID=UPI00203BCC78|nr:DUF2268 domain-containing putative Zn-dependent protease [Neobacillus cucumis]MCM3725665.1 DUF2268 domain-containing protein [Neobacillus cucumis]
MGIIRTDQWLEEDFDNPLKICEKLLPYFKGQTEREIYRELMHFGMYQPSRSTKKNQLEMLKQQSWDKVEKIFAKYKNRWSGPDIPIFLFPIAQAGGFFKKEEKGKAGVSFPDKMFLFLSNYDNPKDVEALFVHEYHHVCRMRLLDKNIGDYTLLDSLIIEGLAEYTVLKYCGSEYLAAWCGMYSEKEIKKFWNRYLKNQLGINKKERVHDELLYGGGRVPRLLGYAAGFYLIENYYKKSHYSTKLSFTTPAESYLKGMDLF